MFNYAYYMNSSILWCESCPYDCQNCYAFGKCSACNISHYRIINVNTGRCDPILGYFDNGIAVASLCMPGCLNCTSLNACISCKTSFTLLQGLCYGTCPSRTYPTNPNSPTSSTCMRCPYDCYTCSSNGNCLSCNGTTDYRTLSNGRCIPLPGYF